MERLPIVCVVAIVVWAHVLTNRNQKIQDQFIEYLKNK